MKKPITFNSLPKLWHPIYIPMALQTSFGEWFKVVELIFIQVFGPFEDECIFSTNYKLHHCSQKSKLHIWLTKHMTIVCWNLLSKDQHIGDRPIWQGVRGMYFRYCIMVILLPIVLYSRRFTMVNSGEALSLNIIGMERLTVA